MEQTRIVYETLINKRCSDSHWSKIKRLMFDCQLPLDKQGFEVLINLRKVSPRYFSKYHEVKDELTRLGRQLLPAIGEGITGEQFMGLIERLGINPNQSTVSRWFRNCGGFRAKGFYSKQTILPIVAIALIYKSKIQNNQLAKIGA
ncbi:hypothetical protein [Nodularia sp. UHCC 0506]|uniref:hypothetical protein n=1 Tax=Nodularia sp. UHCC 0506 TaxID=3110243 RepID=UPI002B22075D|nr:hypothetical protein [Nodularia sp. UHCC 0506]MEA5515772.1 hypothetical protein [Nodularia sp. UHCC 0506]